MLEDIMKSLDEIKEILHKIIEFPKTILSWWENFKEALWSPFEIATTIAMLGLIISMVDQKIGLKILRYTIVIYFILEVIQSLF